MQSRVVIVTGSTQGLGEGIATCFAREGASVVLNGRSQPRGEALENKLRGIGASVKFFPADLSVKEAAQQLVHDAARHFGRLDVLVNNAQIVPDLLDAESAASDSALEVALRSGLYASLWTSQAALPYFKKAGGGRIVNFASLNGVYGSKYGVAYNAAKEGIRGFAKTLKAIALYQVIIATDVAGAALDAPDDPTGTLLPIVTKAEVYQRMVQLLDEAKTHLQAGGASFAFGLWRVKVQN